MFAARNVIRNMRVRLHALHGIPALYYPAPGATGQTVTVRLIDPAAVLTNPAENRYGLGANEDAQPKLIFMLAEREPQPNAFVSLEVDEVYRILTCDPPHDITMTAHCVRLSLADCVGYPPPPA